MNKHQKIVILLFPEGTTHCKETFDKSNDFCKKKNINPFHNLLAPRVSGFKIIKKIFKPDEITNNIIYYLDDIDKNKIVYERDILKYDIIHRCKILSSSVGNSDTDIDLFKVWRENDDILKTEYKKLRDIHDTVVKYYNVNNNLINKNYLMFHTAKMLILLLPVGYYLYGLFFSAIVVIVFLTSLMYHKHGENKKYDIFFSTILFSLCLYNASHHISYFFLSLALISYLLGLFFSNILNYNDIGILFHCILHILSATHILIEFKHYIAV